CSSPYRCVYRNSRKGDRRATRTAAGPHASVESGGGGPSRAIARAAAAHAGRGWPSEQRRSSAGLRSVLDLKARLYAASWVLSRFRYLLCEVRSDLSYSGLWLTITAPGAEA